jgi:hypothetical protein
MWVFIRPGVVRIAICSCRRLGQGWNSVQFMVLMEWIKFGCQRIAGDLKPRTVRKRIPRSEKKVRV